MTSPDCRGHKVGELIIYHFRISSPSLSEHQRTRFRLLSQIASSTLPQIGTYSLSLPSHHYRQYSAAARRCTPARARACRLGVGIGGDGSALEDQVQSMDLSLTDLALFLPPSVRPNARINLCSSLPLFLSVLFWGGGAAVPVHPHSAVTLGRGTCLDKQNSQIKARSEGEGEGGGVIHLVKPVIAVESSRLIDIITCSVSQMQSGLPLCQTHSSSGKRREVAWRGEH